MAENKIKNKNKTEKINCEIQDKRSLREKEKKLQDVKVGNPRKKEKKKKLEIKSCIYLFNFFIPQQKKTKQNCNLKSSKKVKIVR